MHTCMKYFASLMLLTLLALPGWALADEGPLVPITPPATVVITVVNSTGYPVPYFLTGEWEEQGTLNPGQSVMLKHRTSPSNDPKTLNLRLAYRYKRGAVLDLSYLCTAEYDAHPVLRAEVSKVDVEIPYWWNVSADSRVSPTTHKISFDVVVIPVGEGMEAPK